MTSYSSITPNETDTINNTPVKKINIKNQLRLCVFANGMLTAIWMVIIIHFSTKETGDIPSYSMANFMRFGPNPDLVVLSLIINTWSSYIWFVSGIIIFRIVQTWVHEIAHPIIGFRIYDPDKKVIEDFTRLELQICGNLMYLFDSVRRVFMIMVSITQLDISLWGTLAGEITSIFTIRRLLLAKKFTNEDTTLEKV